MSECPCYLSCNPEDQAWMVQCHGTEECCNCSEGLGCFGE